MDLTKFLRPTFLVELDRYFLVNYRVLWMTKIHYVTFYGLLFFSISLLTSFIYPVSILFSLPNPYWFFTLFFFIGLLGFSFWAYYQRRFSIEKNHGKRFLFHDHAYFLIIIYSVFIFIAPSFLVGSIIHNRIANLIDQSSLKVYVKQLNEGNVFFPTVSENGYDHEDNIFASEDDNYSEYVYISSFFNTGKGFEEVSGIYDESEKSARNAIEAIDNKEERIVRFIEVFNKLGGNLNFSPHEVLDWFGKKQLFDNSLREKKYYFKYKLAEIDEYQSDIGLFKHVKSILFSLSFLCAVILQIFLSNNMKEVFAGIVVAIIAFLLIAGLSMLTVYVFSINKPETVLSFAYFLAYSGLLYFSTFRYVTQYSFFKLITSLVVQVSSPLLPFLVCILFLPDLAISNFLFLFFCGASLYIIGFMPYFQRFNLKMHSLPRA